MAYCLEFCFKTKKNKKQIPLLIYPVSFGQAKENKKQIPLLMLKNLFLTSTRAHAGLNVYYTFTLFLLVKQKKIKDNQFFE